MLRKTELQSCIDDDLLPFRSFGRYSDSSIAGIRADALAGSILKKYQDAISPDARVNAIQKFLECNNICGSFVLEPKKLFHEEVLAEVKHALFGMFNNVDKPIMTEEGLCGSGYTKVLNWHSIFEHAGLGPGANVKVKSNDFYTKMYNSPLSSTSESLLETYRSLIAFNPSVLIADEDRQRIWGNTIVQGSNLTSVPKTYDIDRIICTEPTLNMFFQKGIGGCIETLLKDEFNINLSKQPDINKTMAHEGSLSGKFATIDLSSASDSISCNLLKAILPSDVYAWLDLTRSPTTLMPTGERVTLEMISSMGNGFTFPLQTLLFATIVKSAYTVLGVKPVVCGPNRNFAVFGDDIIVNNDTYPFIAEILELCGFKVNLDKSFHLGSFRESCGGDYYAGYLVRGVYIKSLATVQHVYSSINRLNRWSEMSGIPLPTAMSFLFGVASSLLAPVKGRIFYVPLDEADTAGIKVPVPPDHYRVNRDGLICYSAYIPIKEDIQVEGRWPYKHTLNYWGMCQAVLGGYVRDHKISVRPDVVRYKVAKQRTPYWGDLHVPTAFHTNLLISLDVTPVVKWVSSVKLASSKRVTT